MAHTHSLRRYAAMSIIVAIALTACSAPSHRETGNTSQSVENLVASQEGNQSSGSPISPLLYGITAEEDDILHDFRNKCPMNKGARVYFNPELRNITVDMDYITADNQADCLKLSGGLFGIPQGTATYAINIYETDLPILPKPALSEQDIAERVQALEQKVGTGAADISYARFTDGAIHLGIRLIPMHCWQIPFMDSVDAANPWKALSPEIQQEILDLQSLNVPVTLERDFVSPQWKDCSSEPECHQFAIGCK